MMKPKVRRKNLKPKYNKRTSQSFLSIEEFHTYLDELRTAKKAEKEGRRNDD